MYYVMLSNSAYATGWERVSTHSTSSAAERKAKAVRKMYPRQGVRVWDEITYDRWANDNLAAYYNRQ